MTAFIAYQLKLLYMSLALGAFLMFSYDILRILRALVRHGSLAVGIEDIIYWLYAGVMTFGLLYGQNDGKLRAYAIAGVFAGMVLYDRLFSRVLAKRLKKLKRYFTIKDNSSSSKKR